MGYNIKLEEVVTITVLECGDVITFASVGAKFIDIEKEEEANVLTGARERDVVVTVEAKLVDVGYFEKKEIVACRGVLEHGVVVNDTEMTGAARVSVLRTPLVPTG